MAVKMPDLVLLDVKMPGIDSYEVCRCLKAGDATRTGRETGKTACRFYRIPYVFILTY